MVLHGFRDKEAGSVEARSDSRDGVNHARLFYPLIEAFLWMPLHGIKWVAVGFHGGDEFFLPVSVGGQDLVKPPQLGIPSVVLHRETPFVEVRSDVLLSERLQHILGKIPEQTAGLGRWCETKRQSHGLGISEGEQVFVGCDDRHLLEALTSSPDREVVPGIVGPQSQVVKDLGGSAELRCLKIYSSSRQQQPID